MSGFYSLPFASIAAKTSGISKVNAAAMYEDGFMDVAKSTPRQNVYACTRLSISGHFFSHTFQSD